MPKVANLLEGLGVILALVFVLWLISLKKKDASIVDIFWGLGFVVLVWFYFFNSPARNLFIAVMTTLWGLRLAVHIGTRNSGRPEDRRYTAMREGKKNFALWSLFFVFFFQGVLLWVIAMPLYFAQSQGAELNGFMVFGNTMWAVGLFFESIGDYQLTSIKADPLNHGKVLNSGLWRYTRHPNYFGDSCLWFGFYFFAVGVSGAWWLVFSPVLMTTFLLKVSGVSLLEKDIGSRRPNYREYIAKTSSFIPWFPKK